jgi:sn-glycerol 3-phosphate transport system substrate-binding protein
MRTRTRTAIAAAALAACLAVAACGGGGSDNGAKGGGDSSSSACPLDQLAKATAPVNITFWHAMNAQNEVTLKALTDTFNSSQQKVHVNLAFQGSYEETLNKYIAAARGGQKPDLVQLFEIASRLAIDSGTVVPAQACVDADHYDLSGHLKRVTDYFTVGGKLWPMPFNTSNLVLYYNKKAFAKAGLDPNKPPLTLDEAKADSQKIVSSGAARHGMTFEVKGEDIEQWFAKAGQPFVDGDNGRKGRATKVLFDNELGLRLFTFEKDMVSSGLGLSVGRNPGGQGHFLSIAGGDSAMTIGSTAALGSVLNVLRGGQFPNIELGIGPMPGIEGDGGVLVGGAALWLVKGDPLKQAAAYTYAKFLNEPQQQADWHAGSGYLPIVKAAVDLPVVKDLWAKTPEYKVAYDQLLAGKDNVASAGASIGAYPAVREAVQVGLEQLLSQGADPKTALATAAKGANAALRDYNERTGG